MFPYYLLVGVSAFICICGKYVKISGVKKRKNTGIQCFFLILIILLALRSVSCGFDLANYKQKFQAAVWSSVDMKVLIASAREPMYLFWEKLVALFTDHFQVYLALTGILCIAPIMYFYVRESEIPLLTIALFLCMGTFSMYFSGLRQAIAMGFAIPAWYAAKNKKIGWFLAAVIIAVFFHNSAIILLVIYPLYHMKITKKWLWFVIPAMAVCFIFNKQVFYSLGWILEAYSDRYSADISSTGAYTMLFLYILFAVFSYVIPNEQTVDHDTIAMRNILLLMIVFQCFVPINYLVMRINYYFITFIPILLPKVIKQTSFKMNQIASLSIYVLTLYFIYYFFHQAYVGADVLSIFPYIPYWKG